MLEYPQYGAASITSGSDILLKIMFGLICVNFDDFRI